MVLRYKEQLGAAIRERREVLGLTQKQVADAAHVKESQTVSRWERGLNLPSDLEALAAALETTIPELMAGIQPPARVAAKLDIAPGEPGEPGTQLDRIEARVEEIYALLKPAAADAPVVVPAAAPLIAKVESQPPPAPARSKRTRAARRRKSA